MAQNNHPTPRKSDLAAARAANLRANLTRRKEQTRARDTLSSAPAVLSPEIITKEK